MKREVPAVLVITRTLPDGTVQAIMSCLFHEQATRRQLGGAADLVARQADPRLHGCKGCLEDWAP